MKTKEFAIYYKDHLGRKNQVQSSGKNQDEAEQKFNILYPDCNVTEIV